MSEPTPVVSYARISSDLQGDEHGVQDQHKLNRETAARHGWTVVFEFTDNDVTPEQWQAVKALFDRRAGRQIYSDGTIGDIVPQRPA